MIGHQAQTLTAQRRRMLGIVSGKGGVGKSTLAVNLATLAASNGLRTLLIDGDAGLANADLLLGLVPRHTLSDWCRGKTSFQDVLRAAPSGLDLLVSGTDSAASIALARAAGGRGDGELDGFVRSRDVTILDLGAGIGDGVLDLAEFCDPVWLVVTPEPTSLADAYTMARRLWERNDRLRIEVVVNRALDRAAGERTHQSLARLTRRFLDRDLALRGVLLEDIAMQRAVSCQEPVVSREPRVAIARQLRLLAESLQEDTAGPVAATPGRGAAASFLAG